MTLTFGEQLQVAAMLVEGSDWEQISTALHKPVEVIRAAVDAKWRRSHRVGYTKPQPRPVVPPKPAPLRLPPEGRYTAHGRAALPVSERRASLNAPPEVLLERTMAELTDTRDFTGQFCGDPPPSRSALARRKS